MPLPNVDFFFSVSGRLVHEWDFAFYKNNGEIANRIRDELVWAVTNIKLDADGDIDVRTEQGAFFITPGGVASGGWLTNVKSFSEESHTFARIMDSLAKCKGSFRTNSYSIRLFLRFTPDKGVKLLGDRGFDSIRQLILGDKTPSVYQSLKFSTTHNKGIFEESIEVEASGEDVQVRDSLTTIGTHFSSYAAFLEGCNLIDKIEDLRPFTDVLKAAEQPRGFRSLSKMK